MNFVVVALTVVAVYALTRSFSTRPAGVLAAVLTACYPFLAFTATTFYPQTLAGLLVVVTLLLTVRARGASGRRRAGLGCLAGLSAGVLTMVVPTFAFVPVILVVWLVVADRRRAAAVCVAVIAGSLLLPAVWTVRNATVFGHFIPLTTSSGFNLLVGNHPGATAAGSYTARAVDPYRIQARRRHLDEYETDNLLQRVALKWISRHPGHALVLYLGKLLNNFAPSNELATKGQNSFLRSVLAAVSFLPLLLLVCLRLALARKRPLLAAEWLMLAVYIGNAVLLAIYVTRARYRLPVDILLISLAAAFLADVAGLGRRDRSAVGEAGRQPRASQLA